MKQYYNTNYTKGVLAWRKWRLAYDAGDAFIATYLKKFSSRETAEDFNARRAMTYCPAFAKEAIVDIRNSIFQRMSSVIRKGSPEYMAAMAGEIGGVDGDGASMSQFLGSNVLDELLVMGKVAVWIDSKDGKPYIYMYRVEEILNWDCSRNPTSILLQDLEVALDTDYGMEIPPKPVYRQARVVEGGVAVQFLDAKKEAAHEEVLLGLDELPLVILDIGSSLMQDICNYQIALLNVASSDISYTLRTNFPIYVEQYDLRADMMHKFSQPQIDQADIDATIDAVQASSMGGTSVGMSTGIRHPIGTDAPSFISPSTDPLVASMAKQEQLKREIRTLVNLKLSDMSPTRASSDSKQEDDKGLEAGLAFIGQELERAERKIAYFWHQYLGSDVLTSVTYPTDYRLKSSATLQEEASKTLDIAKKLPSKTAQRELVSQAVIKMFGGSVTSERMATIQREIEEADILYVDPEILFKDIEAQLVSNATASKLRGYAEGESELATIDHTNKLSRIAVAQSEAALIANQDSPGLETLKTEKEKKQDE